MNGLIWWFRVSWTKHTRNLQFSMVGEVVQMIFSLSTCFDVKSLSKILSYFHRKSLSLSPVNFRNLYKMFVLRIHPYLFSLSFTIVKVSILIKHLGGVHTVVIMYLRQTGKVWNKVIRILFRKDYVKKYHFPFLKLYQKSFIVSHWFTHIWPCLFNDTLDMFYD